MIKSIGEKLCYPEYVIEKSYDFAKKTFYNNEQKPRKDLENVLCLPYHESFSNIVPILRNINVDVVFKFPKTIKNVLIKNSPEDHSNVIYAIDCDTCKIPYLGQTTKGTAVRVRQHQQNVRKGMTNSGIFVHLNNHNFEHSMNWQEPKILLKCNDFHIRNITESAIIQITKNRNMNLSGGLFALNPLDLDLMKKDLSKVLEKLDEPV